jgi:hypothetical protein
MIKETCVAREDEPLEPVDIWAGTRDTLSCDIWAQAGRFQPAGNIRREGRTMLEEK